MFINLKHQIVSCFPIKIPKIVNSQSERISLQQVAGAIVKSGGKQIQDESDEHVAKNGPVKTGGIAVTGPGLLPCKVIIHAVGRNLSAVAFLLSDVYKQTTSAMSCLL